MLYSDKYLSFAQNQRLKSSKYNFLWKISYLWEIREFVNDYTHLSNTDGVVLDIFELIFNDLEGVFNDVPGLLKLNSTKGTSFDLILSRYIEHGKTITANKVEDLSLKANLVENLNKLKSVAEELFASETANKSKFITSILFERIYILLTDHNVFSYKMESIKSYLVAASCDHNTHIIDEFNDNLKSIYSFLGIEKEYIFPVIYDSEESMPETKGLDLFMFINYLTRYMNEIKSMLTDEGVMEYRIYSNNINSICVDIFKIDNFDVDAFVDLIKSLSISNNFTYIVNVNYKDKVFKINLGGLENK